MFVNYFMSSYRNVEPLVSILFVQSLEDTTKNYFVFSSVGRPSWDLLLADSVTKSSRYLLVASFSRFLLLSRCMYVCVSTPAGVKIKQIVEWSSAIGWEGASYSQGIAAFLQRPGKTVAGKIKLISFNGISGLGNEESTVIGFSVWVRARVVAVATPIDQLFRPDKV